MKRNQAFWRGEDSSLTRYVPLDFRENSEFREARKVVDNPTTTRSRDETNGEQLAQDRLACF